MAITTAGRAHRTFCDDHVDGEAWPGGLCVSKGVVLPGGVAACVTESDDGAAVVLDLLGGGVRLSPDEASRFAAQVAQLATQAACRL